MRITQGKQSAKNANALSVQGSPKKEVSMKKGLVSVLLTASMASMLLAGCGGGGEAADTQGQAGAQTGERSWRF